MKIIEELSDMIEEEFGDAEKYINCAAKVKKEDRSLADTFYLLSNEEMEHAAILHDQVMAIIVDYQKEHGNPPPDMLTVYKYLHQKHVDRAREIRTKQSRYRG